MKYIYVNEAGIVFCCCYRGKSYTGVHSLKSVTRTYITILSLTGSLIGKVVIDANMLQMKESRMLRSGISGD